MGPDRVYDQWGPREHWTLPHVLAAQAAALGDEPFLQADGPRALTFREVAQGAQRIASQLTTVGVGTGDYVVTMVPTSELAVLLWFGIAVRCAVDIPLNLAYRGNTLVHGINLSGARVLVIDPAYLPQLTDVQDQLTNLEAVVLTRHVDSDVHFGGLELLHLDDIVPAPDPDLGRPSYSSTASIVFTSGTTGPAKGVQITHAHAFAYAQVSVFGFRMTRDDVFYCFHPLFHVGGKGAIYCSLVAGSRVVLRSGFDPSTWIDDIRTHGATLSIGHGPMLEMVFAQPERPDDGENTLRAFMAAPFPTAIADAFERRFRTRGIEVYGMTEVGTPVWRPYDEPLIVGSSGKVLSDLYELAVVDPVTDEQVPTGEAGEITIRPLIPWIVTPGYLAMPEATVAAWRNGRFHTGDVGYIDADGYLHFVDRSGDRIRRRAENIASYEIEVAACSYGAVREAAAVGVPSGYDHDDDVLVFVVADERLEVRDLLTHLARSLPHYMVPRYIEQIEALPRSVTNKIQKKVLRARGVSTATWDRKMAGVSLRALTAQAAP